ncbi:hypothetical protein BXZ70DRAFT_962559 [Cristinia sonorae]|uniref:F-box domain-containing protein n=1 Tax=Cristinia sonorae TaxID=1940300 RepID=A0A8K0XJV5_9AGAR|nr:hypothetical protein BXZ70DRAFT_962559 [Cristinia sonorae]
METMATVWDLPPEILARIFTSYHDESLDPSTLPNNLPRPCLRVTWVCRYWRNVALATPAIWSTIQIFQRTQADTVRAFLERSAQAALNIQIDSHQLTHCGDAVRYVLPSLVRARCLSIDLSPQELESLVCSDQLPSSAPLLEIFRFAAQEDQYEAGARLAPSFAFHNCAVPNLRQLILSTPAEVLWSDGTLPQSLQSLTVTCTVQRDQVSHIVRLISALPLLTFLELSFRSIGPYTLSPTSGNPTPQKPNLKQFHVAAEPNPSTAIELIGAFATAGQTSITVCFRDVMYHSTLYELSSTFASHLSAGAATDSQWITVQTLSLSPKRIQFFKRESSQMSLSNPDLEIAHKNGRICRNLLENLFPDLPLEDVSVLILQGVPVHPYDSRSGASTKYVWHHFFHRVSRVHTLVLMPEKQVRYGDSSVESLRAVAAAQLIRTLLSFTAGVFCRTSGQTYPIVPVLLNLRRIVMDGVTFYDGMSTVDVVVTCCRVMLWVGLKLEELEIRNCRVDAGVVTILRMQQPIPVLWDGKER